MGTWPWWRDGDAGYHGRRRGRWWWDESEWDGRVLWWFELRGRRVEERRRFLDGFSACTFAFSNPLPSHVKVDLILSSFADWTSPLLVQLRTHATTDSGASWSRSPTTHSSPSALPASASTSATAASEPTLPQGDQLRSEKRSQELFRNPSSRFSAGC